MIVIMLGAVMLSVVMLCAVVLSAVMLSFVILSVLRMITRHFVEFPPKNILVIASKLQRIIVNAISVFNDDALKNFLARTQTIKLFSCDKLECFRATKMYRLPNLV